VKSQPARAIRAGQRVRVKASASSEYAGREGIVMFIGDTACDVKIVDKDRGRKTYYLKMDTILRSDLEDFKGRFELAG